MTSGMTSPSTAHPKGRIASKFKIPQRADMPDNVTPTWINLAPMSAPGRTSDCIHTNVTPSRLLGRQLGVPRTELVYVCTQCAPQHNCRTAHPAFIVTAPPIRLRQQHYYIPLDAHTLRHAPPTRPGGAPSLTAPRRSSLHRPSSLRSGHTNPILSASGDH